MTDEDRARELLIQAAELPDSVQPPVPRLLEHGRGKRARRATLSLLAVAAVSVAAVAVPLVIRGLASRQSAPAAAPDTRGLFPPHSLPTAPGPTAAQLARFRWSALPPSPLGFRSLPLLAWTGKELIELGGTGKGLAPFDGAAFDIATGRWHRIAPVSGNVGFTNAVTAWTGHQLFVTNDQTAACRAGEAVALCRWQAGLYDPATNQWSITALPRQLAGLQVAAATWTGHDVVLAAVGADRATLGRLRVAAYNPAANRWQMITPTLPTGHPAIGAALVATDRRLLLWSLWSRAKRLSKSGYAVYSGVDILALGSTGRWTDVTTRGWPQHVVVQSPVYAAGQILIPPGQIWCGLCSHPGGYLQPALVKAGTLALTVIPRSPVDLPYQQPAAIWLWNGSAVVAANVVAPAGLELLAAWDPATRTWHRLAQAPDHPAISSFPVWAGAQLLELTDSGALLSFHR